MKKLGMSSSIWFHTSIVSTYLFICNTPKSSLKEGLCHFSESSISSIVGTQRLMTNEELVSDE